AQTTEEHFDRAASGAKRGASEAQNQAQHVDADSSSVSHEWDTNPELVGSSAIPCDTQRLAAKGQSGEGGIRTLGLVAQTPVFETDGAFIYLEGRCKPTVFPAILRFHPAPSPVDPTFNPAVT